MFFKLFAGYALVTQMATGTPLVSQWVNDPANDATYIYGLPYRLCDEIDTSDGSENVYDLSTHSCERMYRQKFGRPVVYMPTEVDYDGDGEVDESFEIWCEDYDELERQCPDGSWMESDRD